MFKIIAELSAVSEAIHYVGKTGATMKTRTYKMSNKTKLYHSNEPKTNHNDCLKVIKEGLHCLLVLQQLEDIYVKPAISKKSQRCPTVKKNPIQFSSFI